MSEFFKLDQTEPITSADKRCYYCDKSEKDVELKAYDIYPIGIQLFCKANACAAFEKMKHED